MMTATMAKMTATMAKTTGKFPSKGPTHFGAFTFGRPHFLTKKLPQIFVASEQVKSPTHGRNALQRTNVTILGKHPLRNTLQRR